MTVCCSGGTSRRSTLRLEIPQGTTWSWSTAVTNAYGDPVDLRTGYEARAEVRARPSSPVVLYTWSSAAANLDLTADGQVILTVEPAESSAWTWRKGVFDLELTDPDGVVVRLASGVVVVTREVTRS